ncbi:hypothetical protein HU200_029663 [Digitaria exilis]|uniref:Uncharacterized protein n=1 Tax=Digitaria exilis TaxID=1010633 RepID=A0A835C1K7_9POAL|nr:hypothetical protein HU200_029663 [Digitaria exilis]
MRAIHSLAALPPGPPPARPPLRRGTVAASATHLRVSSLLQPPPPAPPSLASRRAAILAALVLAAAPARPDAAAAFSLGIRAAASLPFSTPFSKMHWPGLSLALLPLPVSLARCSGTEGAAAGAEEEVGVLPPRAHRRLPRHPRQGPSSPRNCCRANAASPDASAEIAEEVRGRIGAAGRDCVPRQRNSIVAFQSKTGVEVCTFSLILNNAASLLTKKDPLKVEADSKLGELIQYVYRYLAFGEAYLERILNGLLFFCRSFSDLGTVVENSNFELIGDRETMKDGLLNTISALDKFEQSVKDCLGV